MGQTFLSAYETDETATHDDPDPPGTDGGGERSRRSCVRCGATDGLSYLYPAFVSVCSDCKPEGAYAIEAFIRRYAA